MAGPAIKGGLEALKLLLKSKKGRDLVKEAVDKAKGGTRRPRLKGEAKPPTKSPTGLAKSERQKAAYDKAVKMGWDTKLRRKFDAAAVKKAKDARAVVSSADRAAKAESRNLFQAEKIAEADKGKYTTRLTQKRDTGDWKPMTTAAKNLLSGRGLTSGARGGKRVTQPSAATKAKTKSRRDANRLLRNAGKDPKKS